MSFIWEKFKEEPDSRAMWMVMSFYGEICMGEHIEDSLTPEEAVLVYAVDLSLYSDVVAPELEIITIELG